jgi:cytosine/adenosine deaminase-related metal-dependent hydrolase
MNPKGPPTPASPALWRLDAAAIADAQGTRLARASILLEATGPSRKQSEPLMLRGRSVTTGPYRVVAVGAAHEIDRHPACAAPGLVRTSLPDRILLPGLVNAHTHLDLTHIGPADFEASGGFVGWVDMVRASRHHDADAIGRSVGLGIRQSLLGGVVAVGDIAGAPRGVPQITPFRRLAGSPLAGVSFVEFFAIGRPEPAARTRLAEFLEAHAAAADAGVHLGLQPHATNTVSLPSFRWAIEQAAARNLPLMTHLAETPEERRFIAEGTGPQRELLERLQVWDDSILEHIGRGLSPVAHLAPAMELARDAGVPFAAAHVNDATDEDLTLLARARATVCYCPRASAYFRAQESFGPHRYRDMLRAGIPVALGTDSIVNLPGAAAGVEGPGMSTLDEMRALWRRDGGDPWDLLRMATTDGLRALGLDPAGASLAPGSAPLGLIAIACDGAVTVDHALRAALSGSAHPDLLHIRNDSCQTGIDGEQTSI